jgi:hypothetical protein
MATKIFIRKEIDMIEIKESALIPLESLQKVNEALNFCGSVEVVDIKTQDQYVNATALFRELGGHIKTLEDERKAVKEPYFQKGKEIDTWFKDPQAALANLKSKLDLAIRVYNKMIEDKRRAEQEKLNREADERRQKTEEAARIEREKAEALRKQAEQASEAEAARLRAQADKADARAQVKENKAETIIAPVSQFGGFKAQGISTRKNWKCEITDPVAFVSWAISGGHQHLLMPNPITCGAWAKSIQQEISGPGYRLFNDEKLQGRAV